MPFFVPALVLVAKAAAPHVGRFLLTTATRYAVGMVAKKTLIAGGVGGAANLTTQVMEYGTDWDKYDIGAVVADAVATAGVMLFPTGAAPFSNLGRKLLGTATMSAVLGVARTAIFDSDPVSTIAAGQSQAPFVFMRRALIATFVRGGIGSGAGILLDQGGSYVQEVAARRIFGVMPERKNKMDHPPGNALPEGMSCLRSTAGVAGLPQTSGEFRQEVIRCMKCH